ncbi:MAG: hypothetical protein AVDCRST_MAG28-3056 [uncultured Rubrobacteraceae bacterium]|uniref:Glycosyltransferase RgtA/B/C/D-like domain-containing protein n=1 Tax=uncultured Rubrobacteraceae bacterium TaxID=349277 RepID=A0A6J4QZL0_9ACTN|nr:MAG: hypothetical protein AVDCRST_MAG28-3056 [uncultured Rubrobacteraceae bacterium]
MWIKTKLTDRNVLVSVAFLVIAPTVAHLLFSWRGFAPVDDGFTLAYSRRILEGQVPHHDFIIIRPFLSPLIHTPFVLFGGEYTYWLSRFFVWFQFACVSWAWVSIVNRAFDNPFNSTTKIVVALISFAASVHYFVLTAWHTVDGMFLASIGTWMLLTRRHTTSRVVGYLLIAAAYLCKQSFLFVAPLSVLLLGDWREKKYWLTIALPAAVYCAYLVATGSLSEAVLQLASQSGIVSTGVGSYLNLGILLGILAGYGSMFLLSTSTLPLPHIEPISRYVGACLLTIVPAFFIAVGLYRGTLGTVSFGVVGMVLGIVLYRVSSRVTRVEGKVPIALIALLLAWSTSLSVGYNWPTLLLGPLFTILIAFAYSMSESLDPRFIRSTLAIAGVAIVLSFGVSRPYYIYREQPSSGLTESLDGVLPGGRFIYTNPNTYDFLVDLDNAADEVSARNRTYVIIPDVPGYWVQARQTNPLPLDWPQPVELSNQYLVDRVTKELEAKRGETTILVQKVQAFDLADGFVPLDDDQYEVVKYVRANFSKTDETEFFELYE